MGSLLFKRKSLCEVRTLYRPLFKKEKCGRLRPNNSKNRKYDRTLHTSSLTIIRRPERDKDRGITLTKVGTIRFGL
jgi:hypothetical protein